MTSAFQGSLAIDQAYQKKFKELKGDVPGRFVAQNYLDNSTALYHGEVIGLSFLPKAFDAAGMAELARIVDTTYTILEKVTRRYIADPALRRLFGFSGLLEELIGLDCGYSCCIPIMRIDIFLDDQSGAFQFCEINTDGTSAMNEDREGTNALLASQLGQAAAAELGLHTQELFDPWVEGFLADYAEYAGQRGAPAQPLIAIVDYLGSASMPEFEVFRQRFEARGLTCLICDVDGLSYADGRLTGQDVNPQHPLYGQRRAIDAVYRRAVTGDLLRDLEGSGGTGIGGNGAGSGNSAGGQKTGAWALVQAARDQAACLIGGFRTQVVHSKQAFCAMHKPEFAAAGILNAAEMDFVMAHMPYTTELTNDPGLMAELTSNKDVWIAKPTDSYGAEGVFAGRDLSDTEWQERLQNCLAEPYVVQHFAQLYTMQNCLLTPRLANGKPAFSDVRKALNDPGFAHLGLEPFNTLLGLFCYNGRFAGAYMRASQKSLIAGRVGGIIVPILTTA